ncbi:LysR family transcriptional regulator [Vaginisenegalia massiliensis]|uniref:LysR family transcriptional regulator n=1 Tax=Vaginisenegalia massiliensis TaxID=2058294 RepID=UPI000F537F4C|nr:LysR family transcriptional regulator [Vaginisenegalia massiliensis]
MFTGLEYIYAVYKAASFSKAAEELHISQPSLSANVKRVEKRLGYDIFDRTTKPISLTEFGQEYMKTAERLLDLENSFEEFVSDYSGLNAGKLRLGGSSFFSALILPKIMAKFHKLYPKVSLMLLEETTHNLEVALQEGQIDLMLDNSELDENVFERAKFAEDYLLLAVPKSFAINQKLASYQLTHWDIREQTWLSEQVEPVPLVYFKDEHFVLLNKDNDTGQRAYNLCQQAYFKPKVMIEVEQQLTAYHIVSLGMGISFLGNALVSRIAKTNEVIYYKLAGPDVERSIYFYWKRDRYKTKAMEYFIQNAIQLNNHTMV